MNEDNNNKMIWYLTSTIGSKVLTICGSIRIIINTVIYDVICRFLDTTAVLMHSPRSDDLQEFLSSVYNARIAAPGNDFVVPFNRGENVCN